MNDFDRIMQAAVSAANNPEQAWAVAIGYALVWVVFAAMRQAGRGVRAGVSVMMAAAVPKETDLAAVLRRELAGEVDWDAKGRTLSSGTLSVTVDRTAGTVSDPKINGVALTDLTEAEATLLRTGAVAAVERVEAVRRDARRERFAQALASAQPRAK